MCSHCGQKCASSGAPAPQLRHSTIEGVRTEVWSGVIGARGMRGRGRADSGAEGTAAAAVRLGVRVVEDEAFAEQVRVVVERRSVEEQMALLVDVDLRPLGALENLVAHPRLALPGERVAQPGAAAALDAHT